MESQELRNVGLKVTHPRLRILELLDQAKQAGPETGWALRLRGLLALQARRSGLAEPLDPALQERFFLRPDQHPSAGRARWDNLEG